MYRRGNMTYCKRLAAHFSFRQVPLGIHKVFSFWFTTFPGLRMACSAGVEWILGCTLTTRQLMAGSQLTFTPTNYLDLPISLNVYVFGLWVEVPAEIPHTLGVDMQTQKGPRLGESNPQPCCEAVMLTIAPQWAKRINHIAFYTWVVHQWHAQNRKDVHKQSKSSSLE